MTVQFNRPRTWLALGISLLMLSGYAAANEGKKATGEFGVMIGFLDGMTINAYAKDSTNSDGSIDSDMGLSGGISFDQAVYRSFWAGLTIDVFQVRKEIAFLEVSARTLNPALRLSFHIRSAGSNWSVRPGIACGVALLEEVSGYKASQYVTLRPFLQTVCYLTPETGFLIEASVFQTLQGGNDDFDIDAGPSFGLRVGLLK